ncbi:hypothetical protein KRZ98_05235 [Sphingobium sp. AS12]|uniref:hypothetical protein n=1 Tax=Sphingobium sp. AS12 TaxID=2849495 RepID=UPI001C314D0B|nr:hypothetical protein [Sphingobium sp. AS12]MBV2147689.1 hypothetical protein [Sphingobium sp. AS12]
MAKVQNFGDNRNKGWCVFCGGPNESRDHTPSRVFLDEPYPADLGVSPACLRCNNGFSSDEAYMACLLECVMAGSAEPTDLSRAKIARLMEGNSSITALLRAARRSVDGGVIFDVDYARVRNVVVKLARGHAAYEMNEPRLDDPTDVFIKPLAMMNEGERETFEGWSGELAVWPELGSRAMNRLIIAGDDVYDEGWLVVQEARYRYRTSVENGLRIRFVIRDFLACEVAWD